ncbi:hypothetical protein AMTRI_Chr03g145930 [Amborella trichopoda]
MGYAIKTVEESLSVTQNQEDFHLLSKKVIEKHRENNYKYLHIGLIQIAVKPLTRPGLNTSVLVCLRDTRHNIFTDSLLGMVESSLCSGPIYFNCFPNFSVSLSDPNILDILTINLKTHGFNMIHGSQNLAIVYRIYYKVMNILSPNTLKLDQKDQTILFQTNIEKSNMIVPKTIKWSDIILPQSWALQNANQPREIPQHHIPNHIIEHTDGNVEIQFQNTSSRTQDDIDINRKRNNKQNIPSRKSISHNPNVIILPPPPSYSHPSSSNNQISSSNSDIQFQGTHRTRDNIVIPTYTSSHPTTSKPSIEELHDFQVCTLQLEEDDPTQYSEEYIASYLAAKLERKQRKINKAFIKKDYLSEENKNIREWYLQRFQPPRLMELLHKKYNKFLHKERLNIGFFHWLKDLCLEKNITIPSFDKIQTIEEKTYISTDGTTTASIHPPEKSIILKTGIPKKNEPVHSSSFYDIVATPYKAIPKEINKKQEYIPHIVEQNNYTNLYLQSLGKQTERIERIVSKELPTVSPIPKSVLFKPPPELNKNKFHIGENNKSLMDQLISKLSQLDLKGVPSPQIHIPPPTITSQIPESSDKGKAVIPEHETMMLTEEEPIIEDTIQNQEKAFMDTTPLMDTINKIAYGKYWKPITALPYHKRPTPVDIQMEEDSIQQAVSYSGRSIVNWQIDGLSELKILDVMRHMTMYASANKMAGNHDQEVAKAIVNGFTGWLRGWWDFYVDDDTKQRILNNTRQWTGRNEQNQEVIYTESDAVNTLIYTITLHFVGSTSLLAARSEDLLSNLRCPTLSHYKWYKDVFFSRLLIREDCQLDHWKEKFIAGLPYLFAEKVKERLRKKHNGIIVYSSYTLGELSAEICAEGLALCTDMKLKRQIDKQKLTKKKELGDFCEQFGYYLDRKNMPDYVKKKKKKYKKEKYMKAKKKNKDKEYYKKSKRKLIKKFSPNTKRKSKLPVCYRCGKIGHYKHQCKLKKKIDSLNLDDSIKAKIKSIMSYDSSSTSSSSYTEEINSNDLDLIGSDSSSTNTETTTESSEDCSCPLPQHNVHTLTQEDNFILDIIDKITDPEEKRAIITQFINITKNKSKSPIIKNPDEYNFSAIIKRVSDQHTSQKEPTISDLKKEIKEIKSEIVQLKGRIQILELQQMSQQNSETDEIEFNDLITDNPIETTGPIETSEQPIHSVNLIDKIIIQKWFVQVKIIVAKNYSFETSALIDSGADLNCINEGLVPSKYFDKTTQILNTADGSRLFIKYKLSNASVCNNHQCIDTPFIMVKGLS